MTGANTLNALDSINGGAGVDTLVLYSTGNKNNLTGTITNVENLTYVGSGTAINGDANIDLANFSNKFTLSQTADTAVAVINVKGQTLAMNKVADTTTLTATFDAAQTSATLVNTAALDTALFSVSGTKLDTINVSTDATKATTGKLTVTDTGNTTKTFNITTSTDNITGTNGNDTINGVLQANGAAGTTVAPGDAVNGGNGVDTFTISVAGSAGGAYTLSAVSTTGVEKVLLSNFDTHVADPTKVDAALMTGVTHMGLSASGADGDTEFLGIKNLVTGEMRNGSADLTLTYNAGVVEGTADTQNLTVSAVTGGTFTANGTETLAITSELSNNKLAAVVSDKLKSVTITGDKDLEITTAIDFVAGTDGDTTIDATINASAFTGKLTVGADANDTDIKGGSGNDTFKMAGELKKTDKIDGGAGTDTIMMTAAALTDQFTNVSNVEIVRFDASAAAAVAMDVSKLSAGVTTVGVDVSDGTDDGTVATTTISNLGSQKVEIKHTVNDVDADGADVVITGAVDTAADSISVTLDAIGAISGAAVRGLKTLSVAGFETVNLESKKSATVTANEVLSLTDTLATALNITGDADLTITSTSQKLTSIDASALTGKLNITVDANDANVKLTGKDDTIAYAANLNNKDTVDGGAGTDKLTATVSGLTAITGKLAIANVETIELTTGGDNTLDLSGVTGATTLSVTANTQTITGLDLATKIVMTDDAILKVTAANATGTDDTLTVERKMTANSDETNTVEAKGGTIENLAIILNDQQNTAANKTTYTLTNFEGKKVTVTQAATSLKDANVDLGTLHKNVATVDMSAVKGTQAASLANATAATTVSLGGTAAATVTGSAFGDTFNIGSTTAAVHAITGGAGTDTVNITMANTNAADFSGLDVEKVNITVAAGADVSTAAGKNFHATVTDITLKGGNSASTYTQDAGEELATTVKTFDASTFGGNIDLSVANDAFDDTVTITGGALATDSVTAIYATAGTYKPKTVGVETLKLTASNGATTAAVIVADLSNTTGVTTVEASVGNADTMTIDKATNQLIKVIDMQNDNGAVTLEVKLADASGATDAVSFELKGAGAGNIDDGAIIKTTDIETVNIKVSSAESISLANVSIAEASKYAKVVLTGDKALTISALNADVNNIDASGMTTGGSVIQTGRSGTDAATYVGSVGADTFIMANGGDAISAGEGADTLVVAFNQVLGGMAIDLNATGDQVTTFNGSANAAVQSGFNNVDLSNVQGTFGADITANATGSTITGTKNADQITLGAGADVVVLSSTATTSDSILSFTVTGTADKIDISAAASGTGITAGGLTTGANLNGVGGAAVAISKGMTTIADNVSGALTAASIYAVVTGGTNDLTVANADNVVYIAIDNGTDTAIARINAAGDAVIDQAEITIVATLVGVADATSLVAANWVDFA